MNNKSKEDMTPEEAIAEISFLKVAVNKVMEQALEMAIQALSQEPCDTYTEGYFKGYDDGLERKLDEPCEDAISREVMLDYLKSNVDDFPDYHEAIEKVLQLPSVTVRQTNCKYDKNGYCYSDDSCNYQFGDSAEFCGIHEEQKSGLCEVNEDKEEQLKKLKAELDYAKFRCTL